MMLKPADLDPHFFLQDEPSLIMKLDIVFIPVHKGSTCTLSLNKGNNLEILSYLGNRSTDHLSV